MTIGLVYGRFVNASARTSPCCPRGAGGRRGGMARAVPDVRDRAAPRPTATCKPRKECGKEPTSSGGAPSGASFFVAIQRPAALLARGDDLTHKRDTATVASESTRASGLAVRYATALYALAEDNRVIDRVADDLNALQSMLDDSDDLRRFIASPVVSRDDHLAGILALADKAEVCDETRRFLGLVAQKRRLFALPGMIQAFRRQLAKRRGETTAEVIAARPLSERQMADVAARLRQVVGNDVTVNASVDPDLLGGMVIRVGSRMVDASLRSKLQRLSLSMKGVG